MKKIKIFYLSVCQLLKELLFNFNGKILLKIDYSQTREQMIADCKFDYVDYFYPGHFLPETLIKGEVTKSAKIFKFRNYYSGTKAIKRMKKAGYKPATLQDLVAFATIKPNFQRKYWVAALENYSEEKRYSYRVSMLLGNGDHYRRLANSEWSDSFLQGNGICCLGIKN